jgi:hypothetical protein
MSRRFFCAAILIISLASVASAATPRDDLRKAERLLVAAMIKAKTTGDHGAVFRAFARMPNVKLPGTRLRAVLAAASVPRDGILFQVLGSAQSLEKSGERVTLRRASVVERDLAGKGTIWFEKEVSLRVRATPTEVTVDSVSGLTFTKSPIPLRLSLTKVVFRTENGKHVADITVGKGPFHYTLTLDLTPPGK